MTPSKKAAYKDNWLARGICTNCGARPHKNGCTRCTHCLREMNLTISNLREERQALGLCKLCGKKRQPNRKFCRPCLDRQKANTTLYRKRIAQAAAGRKVLPQGRGGNGT